MSSWVTEILVASDGGFVEKTFVFQTQSEALSYASEARDQWKEIHITRVRSTERRPTHIYRDGLLLTIEGRKTHE